MSEEKSSLFCPICGRVKDWSQEQGWHCSEPGHLELLRKNMTNDEGDYHPKSPCSRCECPNYPISEYCANCGLALKTPVSREDLYIWWVSQPDCERIGDGVMLRVLGVPYYLYSEFQSRLGRAGRCRLWTAPQFDLNEIGWDEAKAAVLNLTDSHGGIVIARTELEVCRKMPGIVTDLNLNYLPGTLPEEE